MVSDFGRIYTSWRQPDYYQHLLRGAGRDHRRGPIDKSKLTIYPGLIRFQLGKAGPLNPLFVGEMMGFPPNWLTSPFQNGERNVCGNLEMR